MRTLNTNGGFPYGRAMPARIPTGAKRGPILNPAPSKAKAEPARHLRPIDPPGPVSHGKTVRKTPVCKIPEATQGQIGAALGRLGKLVADRIEIEAKAAQEVAKKGIRSDRTADKLHTISDKLTAAFNDFRLRFAPVTITD